MLRMLDNYFDDPRPKANIPTGGFSCQSFLPVDDVQLESEQTRISRARCVKKVAIFPKDAVCDNFYQDGSDPKSRFRSRSRHSL